jgi:hypothetical protein
MLGKIPLHDPETMPRSEASPRRLKFKLGHYRTLNSEL